MDRDVSGDFRKKRVADVMQEVLNPYTYLASPGMPAWSRFASVNFCLLYFLETNNLKIYYRSI